MAYIRDGSPNMVFDDLVYRIPNHVSFETCKAMQTVMYELLSRHCISAAVAARTAENMEEAIKYSRQHPPYHSFPSTGGRLKTALRSMAQKGGVPIQHLLPPYALLISSIPNLLPAFDDNPKR